MNPFPSSTIHTGTPSSTGLLALPLAIHRVCSLKIENTFSACGIAFPSSTRRATRNTKLTTWSISLRTSSRTIGGPTPEMGARNRATAKAISDGTHLPDPELADALRRYAEFWRAAVA